MSWLLRERSCYLYSVYFSKASVDIRVNQVIFTDIYRYKADYLCA